jgi:uncharacterized protein YoxC
MSIKLKKIYPSQRTSVKSVEVDYKDQDLLIDGNREIYPRDAISVTAADVDQSVAALKDIARSLKTLEQISHRWEQRALRK